MIIDLIVIVLLTIAALKGYRLGLIAAVFSYLAFIIGLAAAMKLSAVVASRLGNIVNASDRWLPFLAFALVFVAIVILVRMTARLVQKFSEKIMLGGLNRAGGVLLYALLYTSVFAIFLFYLNQLRILPESVTNTSATYNYVRPLGRYAIDGIGYIVPAFKNLFGEMEQFFGKVSAIGTG